MTMTVETTDSQAVTTGEGVSSLSVLCGREVWRFRGHALGAARVLEVVSEDSPLVLSSGGRARLDEVIILPRVGDWVTASDDTQGQFLAVTSGEAAESEGMFRAALLTEEDVLVTTVDARALNKVGSAVAYAGPGLPAAQVDMAPERLLRALAQAHHQLADEVKRHKVWTECLVEAAHEWANESDLCERFDEFMQEMGLPARTRSDEVLITATIRRVVEVPADKYVSEAVTSEEVIAWLHEAAQDGTLDWEVE